MNAMHGSSAFAACQRPDRGGRLRTRHQGQSGNQTPTRVSGLVPSDLRSERVN